MSEQKTLRVRINKCSITKNPYHNLVGRTIEVVESFAPHWYETLDTPPVMIVMKDCTVLTEEASTEDLSWEKLKGEIYCIECKDREQFDKVWHITWGGEIPVSSLLEVAIYPVWVQTLVRDWVRYPIISASSFLAANAPADIQQAKEEGIALHPAIQHISAHGPMSDETVTYINKIVDIAQTIKFPTIPSEQSPYCTLTDTELIEVCDKELRKLIDTGGKSFVMHVPARPNSDIDLVLSELIQRFKKLSASPAVDKPVVTSQEAEEIARRWYAGIVERCDIDGIESAIAEKETPIEYLASDIQHFADGQMVAFAEWIVAQLISYSTMDRKWRVAATDKGYTTSELLTIFHDQNKKG